MKNKPLKFPIPIVLDLTACRKCRMFCCGNCLKIGKKLHGRDRKHIKMSYFSPHTNFHSPYLKIGVHNLILALLNASHISSSYFSNLGLLHKWKQNPGRTRPARPLRCSKLVLDAHTVA